MPDDQRFNEKIKRLLDEELQQLEPQVVQRLQQARMRAVDAVKPHSYINAYINRRAVATFAFSAMLVLAVFLWPEVTRDGIDSSLVSELELFVADDNLQLYEELEFYEWLLASDSQAG